jgi:hypothetical protein
MLLISMLAAAAQTVPVAQPAAKVEDKVVCRMIQEANSRIPSRTCRKTSEWDRIEKETEAELRSSRHKRTAGGMSPGQ